jgi:3-deoxy-manno-octulosonate cytidylyltransferase (CMP-KDO synthetase)
MQSWIVTLHSKKIKVVIPARYNSSRLPGKPLIDLCGKPMIIHVSDRVRSALPSIDIWIATDDDRIKRTVEDFGYSALITSTRHESGLDRIADIAKQLEWPDDSIIINVQGDEPLIETELLKAFAKFCSDNEALEMASVMVSMDSVSNINDPNVVKVLVNNNGEAITFSRSPIPFYRDLSPADWPIESYNRHVGIYAYRASVLKKVASTSQCEIEKIEKLEQLRAIWLGYSICMMSWSEDLHGGVDTEIDVERVRKSLNKRGSK